MNKVFIFVSLLLSVSAHADVTSCDAGLLKEAENSDTFINKGAATLCTVNAYAAAQSRAGASEVVTCSYPGVYLLVSTWHVWGSENSNEKTKTYEAFLKVGNADTEDFYYGSLSIPSTPDLSVLVAPHQDEIRSAGGDIKARSASTNPSISDEAVSSGNEVLY